MKTTHHCPKCDSSKIVMYKGSPYNTYSAGATSKWGAIVAKIDRYFCVDCGYTEEYAQLDKKFMKWANAQLDKQGWNPSGSNDFV